MSKRRKQAFIKMLDFCMRYARECQFMQHSQVAVYKMEDYGVNKERRKYQRYDICDKRRRDELVDQFESWVGDDGYPILIRIEFTPAKVSMNVFVRWLRMLGTFMRKNSSANGDAVYIEEFESDYTFKWHINIQSFFETKQIQDIWYKMYPNALEKDSDTQTIIDGLAGMHKLRRHDYVTQLCVIRKYPDIFKGYEVKTEGEHNYSEDGKNTYMCVFLSVKKKDGTMTVNEALDFWKEHFLYRLSDGDRDDFADRDELMMYIYVICDDKTFKTGNEDNDYVRYISLKSNNHTYYQKHYYIIAVDRNLVPYVDKFKNERNENGAVLSKKQRNDMKRSFNNMYERWRLNVLMQ